MRPKAGWREGSSTITDRRDGCLPGRGWFPSRNRVLRGGGVTRPAKRTQGVNRAARLSLESLNGVATHVLVLRKGHEWQNRCSENQASGPPGSKGAARSRNGSLQEPGRPRRLGTQPYAHARKLCNRSDAEGRRGVRDLLTTCEAGELTPGNPVEERKGPT